MKNLITIFILFFFACIGSCTLDTSDNGDLDGNWQLMSIDSIENGNTADMKDYQIFYAVQFKLINVKAYNYSSSGNYYFHFEQTKDSLIMNATQGDNGTEYKIDDLRKFGLNSENEKFSIITLTGDKMILESSLLKLYFRKF